MRLQLLLLLIVFWLPSHAQDTTWFDDITADVGLTGARDSVIGMEIEPAIQKFITARPVRFEPAKADLRLHGVVIDIDDKTGTANAITRLSVPVEA